MQGNSDKTNKKFHSVQVEGCGCYEIYSRKKGKGTSAMVSQFKKLYEEDIGFTTVKSYYKTS